jgi:hypothetical protein
MASGYSAGAGTVMADDVPSSSVRDPSFSAGPGTVSESAVQPADGMLKAKLAIKNVRVFIRY